MRACPYVHQKLIYPTSVGGVKVNFLVIEKFNQVHVENGQAYSRAEHFV